MESTLGFIFVFCALLFCASVSWAAEFSNEYEYSIQREDLMRKDAKNARNRLSLNEDEILVDHYLRYLKWEEYKRTAPNFLPSRPIEESLQNITSSNLYRVLKKLPKGGNMHAHENHVGSRRKLIDLVFESEDFQHFYVQETGSRAWSMGFYLNPPAGWAKVQGNSKYSRDVLAKQLHLIGVLSEKSKRYPTDAGLRWKDINPLWGRPHGILSFAKLRNAYLKLIFDTMLEEGVQFIESKRSLSGRLYVLDPDPKYRSAGGRRLIDLEDGDYEIRETIKFLGEYEKQNSDFIGMKNTIYTTRSRDHSRVLSDMERAVGFHKKYPNFIVGFDMVGEEDQGNSLLFHMESFVKLYENKTERSRLPTYLHTAETNMPGDLQSSPNDLDPVSTLNNAADAILLGAKRVGHGLGYIKHPYLEKLLKQKDIAVEICPVSNQILAFFPDIRVHPAVNYIRSGVPVVLGSDDPATFGYDYFTVDWYEAFMSWGLDLADLKLLAQNSLRYSSMTASEKKSAIDNKWLPLWKKFIREMAAEACQPKFTSKPIFARVFPNSGSLKGTTKVNIYGKNFESGMCNQIKCKFGDYVTDGQYISNRLITCSSNGKRRKSGVESVNVKVSFNNGAQYVNTGSEFTYRYNKYEIDEPDSHISKAFSVLPSIVFIMPITLASMVMTGFL